MADGQGAPAPARRERERERGHRRIQWRALLRSLHRDAGYLAVGLTIVYAVSGLAINHIQDWNPNFRTYERIVQLDAPLPDDDAAAVARVLALLDIDETPRDHYRAAPGQLEIELDGGFVHVDTEAGRIHAEGQEPRFFLRVANWLHYNRGKAAWTYIADGYAVFLLFLAGSGLFMLKGRKGLAGRGGVLVLIGALVPILYVHFSGGP